MLVVWYLLFSFQLLHMIQQTHFNLIGVCNVINTKGSNNTLLLGKTKNSKMTFHFNLHQVYLTQVSPISFEYLFIKIMAKKSSFICLHKRRFLYIIKKIFLLLNSQCLSLGARPPSLPTTLTEGPGGPGRPTSPFFPARPYSKTKLGYG